MSKQKLTRPEQYRSASKWPAGPLFRGREERRYFSKQEQWAYWNTILNMLRTAKGVPSVPPEANPYFGDIRVKR